MPNAFVGPLLAFVALAQVRDHRPGFWTISVRYPRFSAGGLAARRANDAAARRERQAVRSFRIQAGGEIPTLRKQGNAREYELTITPHRIADRPGLASGYVERYDYIAGAHGTTRYEVLNYGPRGPLRLRDLFRPGVDAAAECSTALASIMRAMKEVPSSVADGSWARLTPAQADRFVVGRLGVLFLFDQYDVGYGAQGAPRVLVPWSRLPAVDRKGVLRPILDTDHL